MSAGGFHSYCPKDKECVDAGCAIKTDGPALACKNAGCGKTCSLLVSVSKGDTVAR